MNHTKLTVIIFVFVSLLANAAFAHHGDGGNREGVLKIKNETQMNFYVVINGYNQSPLDANDSEEFKLPFGEHKVVLEYNDGASELKRHIKISDTDAVEWTITDKVVEYKGRDIKW